MGELFPIDLSQQLKCVEREIEMRNRVYPRWVASKKLTQAKADQEIAAMQAVAKTLRSVIADQTAEVVA